MMKENIRVKQWLLLAAIALGLVGIAFVIAMLSSPKEPAKPKTHATEIRFNDKTLAEEHFVTEYGTQMQALEEEVRRIRSELKAQEAIMERKNREKERRAAFDSAYDESFSGEMLTDKRPGEAHSFSTGRTPQEPQSTPVSRLTVKKVSDMPQAPKKTREKTIEDLALNRTEKKKAEELLITGTFARARLLNGVEAPTGGQANGNPMPMLLELTDLAVLPNRYRSDLKRCFVTATGTGDLSSERVLVRLDRLACLTENGGAIDVKLTGYVTGEDGKTGLKARVVTRSGQAIANALLVGTLSGLGEAVSLAAQESTTNFAGTESRSVKNPWRAGIGSGMEDALDRIADYYLKLADKIFPVLEVDAGRTVDIVVTQSASIATR